MESRVVMGQIKATFSLGSITSKMATYGWEANGQCSLPCSSLGNFPSPYSTLVWPRALTVTSTTSWLC